MKQTGKKSLICILLGLVLCVVSAFALTACKKNPEVKKYTVVFMDGDTQIGEQIVEQNKTAELPADPEKAATNDTVYAFAGWALTVDGEVVTDFVIKSNTTFYAVYTSSARTYEVKFVNGDAQVGETQILEYNATATAPTNLTKEATAQYTYTFDGWYMQAEGGEKVADFTVKANATYYARFTATVNKYDVKFMNGETQVGDTQNLDYGATATAPTVTKEATAQYTYTFDGWYTQADGGEKVTDFTVTKNATYYARFTATVNKYDVKFMNDGAQVGDTQNLDYGATATAPTVTKEATAQYTYTFDGWYTQADGGEKVTDFTVKANATYYARFNQTVNAYTVTWKNGEAELKTDTVEYGVVPEYKGETPVKAGDAQYSYTFKGWDKDVVAVTGDVTYTAVFNQIVNKYTLVWKNYNGETVRTDVEAEYGSAITAPANTVMDGYTFAWGDLPATVTGNAEFSETRTVITYKFTVKFFDTDIDSDYANATEIEFTVENKADKAAEVKALLPADTEQYAYAWKDGEPALALTNGEAQINRTTKSYTVTYFNGKDELETETVKYGKAATYKHTIEDENFADGYKKSYIDLHWVDAEGEALSLASVTENVNAYLKYDTIVYSAHTNKTGADEQVLVKDRNKFIAVGADGIMNVYIRATGSSFYFFNMSTGDKADQWVNFTNQWYRVEFNFNDKTAQYYEPNGNATGLKNLDVTLANLYIAYRASETTDIGVMNPDIVKVTYFDGETKLAAEHVLKGQSAVYEYESDEAEIVLGGGYTIAYFGYKWVSEQDGTEEVSLANVTEDKVVYLNKQYVIYSRVEQYDAAAGYKSVVSLNKYVMPDSNGNIEFLIRLLDVPSGGSSFTLYEKQTYTDGTFGQWVNGNENKSWFTVKGDAQTKTVTVYDANGNKTNSMAFENYNANTLSLVLNCTAEIAVAHWGMPDTYSVTYYDADGSTVLNTERLLSGYDATYKHTIGDEDLADGYKKSYLNLRWVDAEGKALSLTNVTENVNAYLKYDTFVYSSYTNTSTEKNVLFKEQNKFISVGEDGIMNVYVRATGSSFCFYKTDPWVDAIQWVDYTNQWYRVEFNFNDKTVKYYNPNGSEANGYANFAASLDNLYLVYRAGVTTDIGVMNPEGV